MTTKTPMSKLEQGISLPSSVSKERKVSLAVCSECPQGCIKHKLEKPFIIATAEHVIAKQVSLPIEDDVLHGEWLDFGQDALHSHGRRHPRNFSVGTNPAELEPKMRALVDAFASGDSEGKAKRLFDAFLSKRQKVEVFTDSALDKAVAQHENFIDFSNGAMKAPGSPRSGAIRIHQALEGVHWNINRVATLTDLGPPAFNKGDKLTKGGDFSTGLGVMMDGVQHVLVIAEEYEYQSCNHQYFLKLKFVMYDVFGLDDDDLTKPVNYPFRELDVSVARAIGQEERLAERTAFGARDTWALAEQQGITAWWQLQHEHDYAPLIARAVVERQFVVSTRQP